MDHSHQHGAPTSPRSKWALIGFLLIGGFFLFTEHRAHLLGILPYLLLLACPLMYLFHSGHRGGSTLGPDDGHPAQSHLGEWP